MTPSQSWASFQPSWPKHSFLTLYDSDCVCCVRLDLTLRQAALWSPWSVAQVEPGRPGLLRGVADPGLVPHLEMTLATVCGGWPIGVNSQLLRTSCSSRMSFQNPVYQR